MAGFTDNERVIAQFFIEREGDAVLGRLRDIDFYQAGIIDSLDMVSLAVFVEKKFGKKLDLTNPQTFEKMKSFESLVRLVEE